MKSDFLIALTQLAAERHLPKEQVLQAIEVALASAFKKDNPASGQNISVKLNPNTGDVDVFALRTVVDVVNDPEREIDLQEAQAVQRTIAIGDELASPEPVPHNASRIAAQTAKQVVLQRLREAERELLFQEFVQHKEDIISGVVEQVGPGRTVTLELGRAQALMPTDEQVRSSGSNSPAAPDQRPSARWPGGRTPVTALSGAAAPRIPLLPSTIVPGCPARRVFQRPPRPPRRTGPETVSRIRQCTGCGSCRRAGSAPFFERHSGSSGAGSSLLVQTSLFRRGCGYR
jgi:hypothetical protein